MSNIWYDSRVDFPDDVVPSRSATTFFRYHLKDRIRTGTSTSILDVGCGRGANLEFFKSKGLTPIGVDINRKFLAEIHTDIETHCASSTSLPFETELFDHGYSEGVFYYGTEDFFVASIRELNRCVKNGGLIRIYTISEHHKIFHTASALSTSPHGKTAYVEEGWESGSQIFAPNEMLISKILPKRYMSGTERFNLIGAERENVFSIFTYENQRKEGVI